MSVQHFGEPAGYDSFAWFYHHHWWQHFSACANGMLDKVLVPRVPAGSRVLDVCCGSGHVARELLRRGYRVTGMDAAEQMLHYAREAAPEASFFCADARRFAVTRSFEAAVCTFDSVNHLLSAPDLLGMFRNVRESLSHGGVFIFDALLEDAYLENWTQSGAMVSDDHACFIRGGYDQASRLARTEVTLFRKTGCWVRSDTAFSERFYPVDEITALLQGAGFARARCMHARTDLVIEGDFSNGRAVFEAFTVN